MIEASEHNRQLTRAFVPRRFVATSCSSRRPKRKRASGRELAAYVDGTIIVHDIACTHETMMQPPPAEQIGGLLGFALG